MRLINKEDLGWISWKSQLCMYVQKHPPDVFCKKRNPQKFHKFTGKKTCPRVFFNKVAGLRLVTLFKKRPWHRCFFCEFCEISKNIFFTEHLLAAACLCHFIPLVRFFQNLKYAYVVHILVFLELIRFVCFYHLMNRDLFRALSNIQVGVFEKIVND